MATVPSPHQFTVGEVVTANNINTYYQGLTFAQAVPVAWCYSTVTQSMTTAFTDYPVSMNTANFDTYGGHSGSRYTAQVAGYYLFHGVMSVTDTGTTIAFWTQWRKNGSTNTNQATRAPGNVGGASFPRTWAAPTLMIQLNVNDYIEMIVTSNTNTQTMAATAPDICYWNVLWVHA